MKSCRVCGAELSKKPLLKYKNMPKVAQKFPDARGLKSDKGVNLEVFQCMGCGLVQLASKPVSYYKEDIRAGAFSPEMKAFRLPQFRKFCSKYGLKGKKTVEIGCGKGEYLSIMKAAGMNAYGTEYSKPAVDNCKANGLKAVRFFPKRPLQKIPSGPFNAFFILNFLEHLPSLNTVLKCAAGNICEGGVGLVEVPNFELVLEKNLFSEFTTDHLFYFTRHTLAMALKINGFDVLDSRIVWHDYIISMEVRKRAGLDIKSLYDKQTSLKREVKGFISKFHGGRVAVWGAGHQALAFMALTGIKNDICYVVDSAPFKQGKFTTATHLPIVPPSALDTDPVLAVIIMAASYSDEVKGIIKRKYGKKIKVAVLRDHGLEICR